jgi:hypothetical protein
MGDVNEEDRARMVSAGSGRRRIVLCGSERMGNPGVTSNEPNGTLRDSSATVR